MEHRRLMRASILAAVVVGITTPLPVYSVVLNNLLAIDGAMRGIVQHGRYNNATNKQGEQLKRETGGAAMIDLEVAITPTPADTLFTNFRFAAGNALNDVGGLQLSPYNGLLADDVININDSGRNFILEAWYRRKFSLTASSSASVSGGLLDSTRYIDENRYANDEDTQFMMSAFSVPDNKPGAPSYDPGAAVELYIDDWSFKGVYLRATNDIMKEFDYFGFQAGYHYMTPRGPGNLRLVGYSAEGSVKEKNQQRYDATMHGLGVSIDQELGEAWGIFLRAHLQNEQAPVVYDRDISAGVSIGGKHWGRPDDVLGIAYAHLHGTGKNNIDHSNVAEAYIKFQLLKSIDFTIDLQYQKDHTVIADGDPQAWFLGGRLNLEF